MGLFSTPLKPGVTAYEAKKALAEISTGDHKWTESQKTHAADGLMGYINGDSPISEKGRMTAGEVQEYLGNLKHEQHKLELTDDQINKLGGALNKYVKTNATPPQFF